MDGPSPMLNVALLGAGRIGRIHALNIVEIAGLRLKWIVDPAAQAAQSLAAECNASVGELRTVLDDPSVAGIIVASSTDTHLDYCLRAVEAGKAVFCEKPLDLDLAAAVAAKPALGQPGARLLMGFNRRFDADFAALRARLDAREVGELETLHIISHDPAPPPPAYLRSSGGLFKDMAIHDFDMARWLLGEEPMEVFSFAGRLVEPGGGSEDFDTAKTLLRTAVGKLCMISNSRRSGYGYDQRIEAFCSAGAITVDNHTLTTVSVWREEGAAYDKFENFFLDRYAGAYRREMAHFARVLQGETPQVGYADAVAALALAEAAGRSARTGKIVKV